MNYCSLFKFALVPKICPFLLDSIGLDISESFLYSCKNYVSVRCASAANIFRDVAIFGTKTISLDV
jgi:hypothetical protein